MTHEYIIRATGEVVEEKLVADDMVRRLYSPRLEDTAWLLNVASSRHMSGLLGYLNYDNRFSARASGMHRWMRKSGIDFSELLGSLAANSTPREVFERKIRYWECRPMQDCEGCAVCPADSRVAIGCIHDGEALPIKEKFFEFPELLGGESKEWSRCFQSGRFAVFRLTPEKYHYTHVPASGIVKDFYAVEGRYHSCSPSATVQLLTPHSKNRRVITILDTDCKEGSGIGLVAVVEVVALMVGQVEQRYSSHEYDDPQPISPGMFLRKGAPKALFRPGSSTVVLLFQDDRIVFAKDLQENQVRSDVRSRYSSAFGYPLVETDVLVRSPLATRARRTKC